MRVRGQEAPDEINHLSRPCPCCTSSENGEFILARLPDPLLILVSQMCYARGGTWLKSLLDSPELLQRRLWLEMAWILFKEAAAWQPPAVMETSQQPSSLTRQGLMCVRSLWKQNHWSNCSSMLNEGLRHGAVTDGLGWARVEISSRGRVFG